MRDYYDNEDAGDLSISGAAGASEAAAEETEMEFTPKPGALYFCDNGSVFCSEHLGASAKYTGRDISGQKIHLATSRDAVEFERMTGSKLACECCRARGVA